VKTTDDIRLHPAIFARFMVSNRLTAGDIEMKCGFDDAMFSGSACRREWPGSARGG
jgi:hypothetical protein